MAASPDGDNNGSEFDGSPEGSTKKGRGNWGAIYTWQDPVHVEAPRRLGCRAPSCAGWRFGRSVWTVSPRRDVPDRSNLEVLQEAHGSDLEVLQECMIAEFLALRNTTGDFLRCLCVSYFSLRFFGSSQIRQGRLRGGNLPAASCIFSFLRSSPFCRDTTRGEHFIIFQRSVHEYQRDPGRK